MSEAVRDVFLARGACGDSESAVTTQNDEFSVVFWARIHASNLNQEIQYLASILTDKFIKINAFIATHVHKKDGAHTGGEILSRLSLSYTTMATRKWPMEVT